MSIPRRGNWKYEASKMEMSLRCLKNRKAPWLDVVREHEGGGEGRGLDHAPSCELGRGGWLFLSPACSTLLKGLNLGGGIII